MPATAGRRPRRWEAFPRTPGRTGRSTWRGTCASGQRTGVAPTRQQLRRTRVVRRGAGSACSAAAVGASMTSATFAPRSAAEIERRTVTPALGSVARAGIELLELDRPVAEQADALGVEVEQEQGEHAEQDVGPEVLGEA